MVLKLKKDSAYGNSQQTSDVGLWHSFCETVLIFCESTSLNGMCHIASDFREMNSTKAKLRIPRKYITNLLNNMALIFMAFPLHIENELLRSFSASHSGVDL